MTASVLWERSPHTAIKHQILREYLGAWLGKLAWTKRILFVDGFAGPGRYAGGEEGSPLIALRLAIEHRAFQAGGKNADCERILLFAERDAAAYSHLVEEIAAVDVPSGVRVIHRNQDFESTFGTVLKNISEDRAPTPAFVMIDPFGWTGFPYSLLERLGRQARSEVFISLMYESMNRFVGLPSQASSLTRLFGTDEWQNMPDPGRAAQRREFLRNLYMRRLSNAGFTYQWSFEMRDKGNRPEYYLIFGSHSEDGLAAMKGAMWKVAPTGTFHFSDFDAGRAQRQLPLFNPPETLRGLLLAKFRGAGELAKAELVSFTITHTDYLEKHLNQALRAMEADGDAVIRRPPRRKRSFLQDVWVTFH